MAVLYLLGIKGIPGESLNYEHRNIGFTQPGQLQTGAALAAGGVSVQDVTFTKYLDKSSPLILEKCCTGEFVEEGYSTSGHPGDAGIPMETITINFEHVEIEYRSQNPDGTPGPPLKTFYNLKENRGG